MKISYNAIFEYADDGINISFPDIPEAITCAYSKNEAIEMAKESLELTLHKRKYNTLPTSTAKENILLKSETETEIVKITIFMDEKDEVLLGKNIVEFLE